MEEKNVKIEFIKEHLGHNVGSTKVVGSGLAKKLADLGIVVVHEIAEPVVPVRKEKSMDAPPENKMVEKPAIKKSFSKHSM